MAQVVNTRDLILQATNPRIQQVTLDGNIIVPTSQVDGLPSIIQGTKVIYLRPTSQVFQVAKNGTVNPGSISLNTILRNVNGAVSYTVIAGTATLSANQDGSQTLTYANMSTDSVTVKASMTDTDGTVYQDTATFIKVREGSDSINMILSNESHTLAAATDGTVSSYTGAGTTATVFVGSFDDTSEWTLTKVDGTGVTSSISGNSLTVTAMTAGTDTSYVDITAARNGYASITKRMSLAKSKAGAAGNSVTGPRGAGHFYVTGNSWTDTAANAACPGGPSANDVVTISNGTTFVSEKVYVNGAWTQQSVVLDGGLIVPGTVTANKINSNGLAIRDTQGNLILGAGTALADTYVPTSAQNSQLVPSIAAAATASFSPYATWDFTNSANSWTAVGATITVKPNSIGFSSNNSSDPNLFSPTIAVDGSKYDKIRMRLRRTGGTAGASAWQGQVYYMTSGHGWSESYTKKITTDPTSGGSWVVLEWDMSNLDAGGTDWAINTITGLRIDLGNGPTDAFEIDWTSIGRYGVNSDELSTNIASAATTATWANVSGTGKPQDNANYTVASKGSALNDDPNLENASNYWTWDNAVVVAATGGAPGGSGINFFAADGGIDVRAWSKRTFSIDPAKTYNLTALMFGSVGNDRNMYLYVNFYDYSGAIISTTWGGTMSGYVFGAVPPTNWTREGGMFGVGTARGIPAAARTAQIGVWFQYTSGTSTVRQAAMDIRCEEVTLVASALTQLNAIADDNTLSKGEKSQAIASWNAADVEWTALLTQADSQGVDRTAYNNAHQTLSNYLMSLSPSWTDTSQDTPITATTWRSNWTAYYSERQKLINALAAKAATTANWSSVSSKPQDTTNLINKPTFEDGSVGAWYGGASVVSVTGQAFSKAMQWAQRDNTEPYGFPVVAGETLYVEGWLNAAGTANLIQFGAQFNNSAGAVVNWIGGISLAASTGWTFVKGTITVPANSVMAFPWLQIGATSNFGTAQATMLRISRYQSGATVGATLGVNVSGQINSSNASTLIASAAIGLAQINTATIGSLSAVSATIGTLRTATSGGRTEIKDNLIAVYNTSNANCIKIGNTSLS